MSPDKPELDPKDNPSFSPELTEIENRPIGPVPSTEDASPTVSTSATAPESPEPLSSDSAAQPSVAGTPFASASTQPAFHSAPSSRFSRKTILIASAIGFIVLLGGTASAFTMWYNKPANVVADMFATSLNAQFGTTEGFFTYKSDEQKIDARVDYQTAFSQEREMNLTAQALVKQDGKSYELNASVVTSKDRKLYVKTEPLKKLVDAVSGGEATMFDGIISKLDGKWLVVTPKDIQGNAEADKQATCADEALRSFVNDKAQQREVSDLYKKHPVVTVTKNHGLKMYESTLANHYELGFDEAKAEAFGAGLVTTDIFKKIDACYGGELKKNYDENKKSRDTKDTARQDNTKPRTEIWIDALTHKPLKLTVDYNDKTAKSKLETRFNIGNDVKVSVPRADVTVDELKAEIERLQENMFGSSQLSEEFEASDLN